MGNKKQFVLVIATEENGYEGETQEFNTAEEAKEAVNDYFKQEAEDGEADEWNETYGDYKQDIFEDFDKNGIGYEELADANGYEVVVGIATRENKSELDAYVEDKRVDFEDNL